MAMPLFRKCFSSFSTYVLPLNFFFKELGFATVSDLIACLSLATVSDLPVFTVYLSESFDTVSDLPAFTMCLSELSLVCLLSLSACLATV